MSKDIRHALMVAKGVVAPADDSHPATQIPGVHISERTHGKPIFTGERVGKADGGSMSVFPKPQRMLAGDDFVQGGKYLDAGTKEDVTGHKASEASIVIAPGGKPSFTASRDAVEQTGSPGRGSAAIKANLFKQKAGWRWSQAPEGHEDTSTIVSVEHRGKHHYALAAHFPKGVELARYADAPSEPRLRPTTQGNIELGPQVGSINVRGREHPVHEHVIAKAEGGLLTGKDEDGEEGITAYQGGPHSVGPEGYDNSKIGTGEGAQVYGYGHYFAEAEPVAREYRHNLSSGTATSKTGASWTKAQQHSMAQDMAEVLPEHVRQNIEVLYPLEFGVNQIRNGLSIDEAVSSMRDNYPQFRPEHLDAAETALRHHEPKFDLGHMHQVRIQGRPEHFLDWDKPLSGQSDHVRKVLEGAGYTKEEMGAEDPLGFQIYKRSKHILDHPRVASEELSRLGIRGIRYLDQGSRNNYLVKDAPDGTANMTDRNGKVISNHPTRQEAHQAGKDMGTRNYVVFDPKHIDIQRRYARGGMAYADGGSLPDAGVQKALDLTRDLNPQGLYSHASEAAMASPQAKGPLPQMLASLKGVKPDELKYSGVNEQFASQPRVTREELAQHFQKSLPDIQETHFGDQQGGGIEREPRYQGYTLPGGENYREILLHLPKDQRLARKRYSVRTFLPLQYDTLEEAQRSYDAQMRIMEERPDLRERMDALGDIPNDIVDNNPRHLYGQEYFRHSHWPVPNVLAHLRLKDRTGPNGEKILHAEEIQSDWGQHARKAGTYNPATPHEVFETTTGNVLSAHATEEEARAEAMKHRAAGNEGVDYGHVSDKYRAERPAPEAPYIGNTQNWTDLVLKRLLHEAAAGSYDKIVWTPGAEQAKRYGKEDSKGMEGYYDKVVPKSLLALAKQHDPEAQLETTRLPVEGRTNTPEDIARELGVSVAELSNMSPQKKQKILASVRGTIGVQGLTVTPRMREGINKRGFKAYARGGDVEGTMRIGKAGGGPLGDDETVRRALALTAQTQSDPVQQAQPPEEPQTISSMISRGTPMPLRTPHPTREEMAAARADTRVGNQIVGQRINTIVPEIARVAGRHYVPGAPGGSRWADLPENTLQSPGKGFGKITDAELNRLWNEATAKSSVAAQRAVKENNVRPNFSAADWDAAMKLPLKDHLWYELSGEKLAENLPDLQPHEHMKLMDLIGATSARAMPGENLERSLGTLSQHLRGVPVDVDLTIPSTVRQALSRTSSESSSLPGNKTGPFSDTLAITGGVPTRVPISVNDVWVGRMFGVPDNVMSQNQSLHEPMAMYFNKLRDLYNKRYGSSLPFKYQSWNFQAPAWVHLRNKEAGATSGDAYHQVWSGIVQKLKDAGIPGIEGDKISREALMHPGFADALRRTTAGFRNAPKATVEFGTTKTPVGQQAADAYKRAMENGDEKSQGEYLSALTTAMYASARGKGHPWERLKKAITGTPGDITRIVHPTSENPLDIGGSFEGEISPNIRVPLKDMTPEQIEHFNAVAGKHLKQKAMATSTVLDAKEGTAPREGHVRGYSAFVPTTEAMDPEHIRRFGKTLDDLGHTFSYSRYPNGYSFDVNPQFTEDGPKGIDEGTLSDAYRRSIEQFYGHATIFPHDYTSVYTEDTDYNRLRTNLVRGIRNDFVQEAVASGLSASAAREAVRTSNLPEKVSSRTQRAWNRLQTRLDHLSASEAGFQELAKRVNDSHAEFVQRAARRLATPASRNSNTPSNNDEPPETPHMASGGFTGSRRMPNHPIVADALRLTSQYGQPLPDAVNLARQHTRGRP